MHAIHQTLHSVLEGPEWSYFMFIESQTPSLEAAVWDRVEPIEDSTWTCYLLCLIIQEVGRRRFLEVNDPDKKASYSGACDGGEEENGKYDGSWLDKHIP